MSVAAAVKPLDIDRAASREEMAAFLERDRLLTAYALADLDRRYVEGARWWLARRGSAPVAAALVMADLAFHPLFLIGESDGAAHLLRHAVREPRIVAAAPPELRPALDSCYRLERVDHMLRMVVDGESFRSSETQGVVRLTADHVEDVIDLYGIAARSYFTPRRLEDELYFGVYEGSTLIAAAGTHVRSGEFGVAAVGNVLTRAPYRNRGLGRACTAAVTAACLAEHRDVVLNVREDNAPAIAVYRRLGYRTHRTFIEGPGYRRPVWQRVVQQIFRPWEIADSTRGTGAISHGRRAADGGDDEDARA